MSLVSFGAARFMAGALLVGMLHAPVATAADTKSVIVQLDRPRIIKTIPGVQTMVIGNPMVADVTMLKGNASMIITGRSFGATSLISLDSSGNTIDETVIRVTGSDTSLIVLRGTSQESYSCSPRCAPTVALGDDAKFMSDGITNAKTRNAAALSGGK